MKHKFYTEEGFYPTVNVIHDQALIEEFIAGIGKRVFIISPSFPYVFVGRIIDVIEDHAVIDVKTTTIAELENREWNIHIHQIEAFYIQQKGQPRIPDLKGGF